MVSAVGADHARASGQQTIGIDGNQHAKERRQEIDPRADRRDDGLEGEEGTFLLCTFWLAKAQAMAFAP
jgi:hypothetical protein